MKWIHAIAAVATAFLLNSGCSEPEPRWVVQERLGPERFGLPQGQPVARAIIGATARPVLGVLAEDLHIEKTGVPLVDGVAQFKLDIASEDIPRANLSIQTFTSLGTDVPSLAGTLREKVFWRRLESGWSLDEGKDGYTISIRDERGAEVTGFVNARVFLTQPSPSVQESESFPLPNGSEIRLFFGSTKPAAGHARPQLRYQASLNCDGRASMLILDTEQRIDGSGDSWEQARVGISKGGLDCRLRLEVRSLQGEPSTKGIWAWPEILVKTPGPSVRPNLLMVSLDTLRADHMSGYGYPRQTTPTIDTRLIAEGTTFLEAFSTFPQTDVSHLSLFTGLYPEAQPTRGRLSPGSSITTLAENLRDAGYQTDAITENALISGLFGFWRGFDAFTERSVVQEKLGPTSFANAASYLRENREQQFFLFLHTYQTHDPYDSSPEFDAMFRGDNHWAEGGPPPYVPDVQHKNVDRYDRTIREADSLVDGLLTVLEETGLMDNTLIVLLSDHGESFGEHSLPGHGFAHHDEQLRIPLILRGPGVPADVRIPGSVSLTDVAPTLLDLLNLPELAQGQGESLRSAMSGTPIPDDRDVFFAWYQNDAIGARNREWKSTSTRAETRNYELKTDPFEWHTIKSPSLPADRQKVLDDHKRESSAIRAALAEASAGNPNGTSETQGIPQRMEESLRALGYLD